MEEYEVLDLTLRNVSLFLFTLMALTESAYALKKATHRKKKDSLHESDWRNVYYPVLLGVLIAWSFYPVTYFSYMPFRPALPYLDVAYTGLLAGRVANGGHAAFGQFGDLFSSWAGRVGKKLNY